MEKKRYKRYEIPASGGNQNVNVASNEETIVLYGSNKLTSSYTLAPAGTAEYGMSLNVLYVANMILNGNNITIFGNTLTASEAISNIEIRLFYDGSSWSIVKKIHNDDASLDISDITSESIDGDAIIPATLSPDKLIQTGADKLIKGDGSGSSEELQISTSDIVSAYGSELKSATVGGVFTASYNDVTGELEFSMNPDIIGMAELDDITRGSIVRGGAGNAPELHDCKTDGYLLGGTGTDAKSMEVGGDVDFSYDSTNDRLNANVTNVSGTNTIPFDGLANGTVKRYFYTNLRDLGVLDGNENTLHELGQGDLLIGISLYVPTAASVGSIDVKTKLSSSYDTFISSGDLTTTGKTSDTNTDTNNAGYFPIVVPGNVVVESSTAISDGEANIVIDVIEVSNEPYI